MAETLVPPELCTELVRQHENDEFLFYDMIPKKPTDWNYAVWDRIYASRVKAEHNTVGSPAGLQANRKRDRKSTPLAYMREKKAIDVETKRWMTKPGDFQRKYGEEYLADELWDLTDICKRTVEWAIFSMLTTGAITVANTENVFFTVTFGQATGHTPTSTTSWADMDNSDPLSDLRTWKRKAELDSGIPVTDFYYSSTVEGYMIGNAKVREWLRNQYGLEMVKSGELPPIIGMRPHCFQEGYASSVGGALTMLLDDGHILMHADPSKKWWKLVEGPSGDLDAEEDRVGWFSKVERTGEPSAETAIVDYHYLPVLQDNSAVLYADIIPS